MNLFELRNHLDKGRKVRLRGHIIEYTKKDLMPNLGVDALFSNQWELVPEWIEGSKYKDATGDEYTLVKNGIGDPNFTNPWVQLIFLDKYGKTKARTALGRSIDCRRDILIS